MISKMIIFLLIAFMELDAQTTVTLRRMPLIGERLFVPSNVDLGRCMVSPGQMDRCIVAEFGGIRFVVGFGESGKRRNIISYMHTDDPSFKMTGDLRVGSVLVAAPTRLVDAPGFEIYAAEPVGWTAVVGFNGEVAVVGDASPDTKVRLSTLPPATDVRLRVTGLTMIRPPIGGTAKKP